MARILLSAPNDRPWRSGPHLEQAIKDLGHEVLLFDFRSSSDPNHDLLGVAECFAPQLHIAWKGEVYRPQTFQHLSARGIFNVLWHPDISMPAWLPPLATAADLCCVQSRGMVRVFREGGINDPEWLMEGITPSCFAYGLITETERIKYECEVVTIGTIDRPPCYRKRLRAINRLLREGVRVRWWGRRMSSGQNRIENWFSPARRAYGGGKVWNDGFAKACHCAKVFLTLPPHPEVEGGLSNGAFIATGIGAFYLSGYRSGMEEFFDLGKEVVVFRDEEEMVEKVFYYLSHDEERLAIAKAGQRRTLGNYTNEHAFQRLFRLVAARGGPSLPPP